MTDLLVLAPDAEEYAPVLRAEAPKLTLRLAADADSARQFLGSVEIVLGAPALVAAIVNEAPRLRWVQSTFAGVDALTRPGLRRDYQLTGVKGVFGPLMSEYVFAWILALERRLFALHEQQQRREWRDEPYRSLAGLTLGVMGLGSIGAHIAGTARAFGMKTIGYRRAPAESPAVDKVYSGGELPKFLSGADYVVVTLPATPATRHLLGREALAQLRPDAVLINVGRGSVIDTAALVDALGRRAIRGAVLDVFEEEPLPPEHPLWTLPGCYITPHNAATSFPADIARLFLENLKRFEAGEPLAHRVEFERGY